MATTDNEAKIYRRSDLAQMLRVSLSTIDKLVRRGELPEPKRLGSKITFWPRHQIDAIFGLEQESV